MTDQPVHFMCAYGLHWWGGWQPAGDVEIRPCLRGCGMFEARRPAELVGEVASGD